MGRGASPGTIRKLGLGEGAQTLDPASASGVAMAKLVTVTPLDGFKLKISFDDGVKGVIDLSGRLFGPAFEALREPKTFNKVAIDEFGALSWPGGADLAPDAIYETLKSRAKAA
jgi:hypothetical protein